MEIAFKGRSKVFYIGQIIGKQKVVSKSFYKLSKTDGTNESHLTLECECGKLRDVRIKNIVKNSKGCLFCSHNKLSIYNYKDIDGSFYQSILNSAKVRDLDVTITSKDIYDKYIEQDKKCKLSGQELSFKTKYKLGNASVDRIDSSKGYVLDNIQIVHKDINKLKTDFNEKYFIKMCKLIAKNNE